MIRIPDHDVATAAADCDDDTIIFVSLPTTAVLSLRPRPEKCQLHHQYSIRVLAYSTIWKFQVVIITALLGWALRRPSGPFRFQASVPSPGIESWQWYHTRFKGQRPVGVASVLDLMMSNLRLDSE